jgi:hypothetical protein
MVRGIERTAVCRDDTDRADFVARLAALAESGALTVYAWALLPSHAHLLVRTGTRPLRPHPALREALRSQPGKHDARREEGIPAAIRPLT